MDDRRGSWVSVGQAGCKQSKCVGKTGRAEGTKSDAEPHSSRRGVWSRPSLQKGVSNSALTRLSGWDRRGELAGWMAIHRFVFGSTCCSREMSPEWVQVGQEGCFRKVTQHSENAPVSVTELKPTFPYLL